MVGFCPMKNQPKQILICEDHQIVIDGLVSIFQNLDDYSILGHVKDGNNVLSIVREKNPEIILLDLNLPNKNGLDILKEIKRLYPEIRVVVLTMYNKESIVKKVKQYGGDAFLLKNCSSDDLLRALDGVFENKEFYIGRGVKRAINETDGFTDKIKLTRREKEIVSELVKGRNVPQIAKALFISSYTVETHKKNIFKKLNIHNSIDLFKLVNENNLLS